jgi:proline iminopeptidase
MTELYVPGEPHASGMLDVGDGNQVHWQASGNPDGKPAVILHGGPGTGFPPSMRKAFDPSRYLVVGFDQRGCGLSTPNASDPATDMSVNTTSHLIADIELLREHLGVERWLVFGGSWGSTLAVAYAEQYPDRVTELVIAAITTHRRSETDWLYRGVARFFPEAFVKFQGAVPEAADGADLYGAYAKRLADPDLQVRSAAAAAWAAWEATVLSLEPVRRPSAFSGEVDADLLALVRICAHYAANGSFLEDGALIRNAGRLAGIPGVMIHGRLDLSCPVTTAWELAQAWPDAKLLIDDDSGHRPNDQQNQWLRESLDAFAAR